MQSFVNKFNDGLNGDLDKSLVSNSSFLEAYNLHLVGDGKFLALENLSGTTELHTIESSFSGTINGLFAVNCLINNVSEKCLLVFTLYNNLQRVFIYRIAGGTSAVIFEEAYLGTEPIIISAFTYPENGIDYVYFTDGVNELRKFRLAFTGTIPQFSVRGVSLQRSAPLCSISYGFLDTTGSLLTGSYQYSVRLFNNTTKAYSKWSIPSTPIIVTNPNRRGVYGLKSTRRNTVTCTLSQSEGNKWTHIQVAAIEHTSETVPVTAVLHQIQSISSGSAVFTHSTNEGINTISITDIVVDQAAIAFAKTLCVKNNRLFVGDITYKNLTYTQNPTITTGQFITFDTPITPLDSDISTYKGYAREEVYRFYAAYFDDKYNFWRPFRLNGSAISGNSSLFGDVAFPDRVDCNILSDTSWHRQLGLSITVDNHPTAARGIAIFRAKRNKKKLFQAAIVPSIEIQGVGAVGDYPNITHEASVNKKEQPSAVPMNPVGTLAPKNLFYSNSQHILRRTTQDTSGKNKIDECYIRTSEFYSGPAQTTIFVYDPSHINGVQSYQPQNGDRVRVVDFAFTRLDFNVSSTSPVTPTASSGHPFDYRDTSIHGTFYANRKNDYNSISNPDTGRRYPSTITGLNTLVEYGVVDYKSLSNFGEGTTMGGAFVGKYENLETTGISFSPPPNNMRAGVILTDAAINHDYTYFGNVIIPNSIFPGFLPGGNMVPSATTATSLPVTSRSGFIENNSYCQVIGIVDIENNLGGDRYGAVDTIHDLEFTGAYHVFTDQQAQQVFVGQSTPIQFNIWGGDTWVSTHNFKITDGHYTLTNSNKQSQFISNEDNSTQAVARWGKFFYNNPGSTGASLCLPVAVKNVSTVLSVVLESEVHGYITAPQPYTSEVPGTGALTSLTESQYRIPFTDRYHRGYLQNSDQKILIPHNPNETPTFRFKSRIHFSDQKVFNTDIQGFDVFPVLNFVDCEETYGAVTVLGLASDNLYALQEGGVVMLPVDSATLSTTDAQTISVRTGTVDIPMYLSRLNGCQHPLAAQILSDRIIFPDVKAGMVFTLTGQQLEPISDKGAITRIKQLTNNYNLSRENLKSGYNLSKRQYYMFNDSFCLVWDDRLSVWQDRLEMSTGNCRLYALVDHGPVFYGIGRTNTNNLVVSSMYTGAVNTFFGTAVVPRVTFTVNPEYNENKTFDVLIAYSTDPLLSASISGERETGATGFVVSGMNFDVDRRDGYYIIPVLRDSNGARIRSTRADVTLTWPTTKVSLSQFITKYRISKRST